MQNTSEVWDRLFNDPNHWTETKVLIAGVPYDQHSLVSIRTESSIFPGEDPVPGGCVSREIDLVIMKPEREIPRQAKLQPMVRLTNGKEHSEWLPKGVFFIDTREDEDVDASCDGLKITGYCALRKAEQDCPIEGLNWPGTDIDVVAMIARQIGVELDPRTVQAVKNRYFVELPTDYSSREVLSAIAAMYGGAFVTSDEGKLLLIQLTSLPEETSYLITNSGHPITFGGVRIIV